MAKYDAADCAVKAYGFVWGERHYLFKLAVFPLFIKLVCLVTVISMGYQFDFIRQSLLMLPSYFADGWVMSHLVRLIYLDQRWPFRPSGNQERDLANLRDRAGGIMAGTVFFALIEFIKTGFTGIMYIVAPPPGIGPAPVADVATQAPIHPAMGLLALALVVFTIWSVRYLWLYIPAAAGFSGRDYLKRVGGLMGSIRLLGVWMMTAIPLLFGFVIVTGLLLSPFRDQAGNIDPFMDFIHNILRAAIDMIIMMVITTGIAFAIKSMYAKA